MRIISLLPSATGTVDALGLGEALVGVTSECDYPPAAQGLTRVTRGPLRQHDWPAEEIDHNAGRVPRGGHGLLELDRHLLHELRPDLILTQAVCDGAAGQPLSPGVGGALAAPPVAAAGVPEREALLAAEHVMARR